MTLDFNTLGLPLELKELENSVIVKRISSKFVINKAYTRKSPTVIAEIQAQYKADLAASRINKTPRPQAPSFYEWKTVYTTPQKIEDPYGAYALNFVHDLIHEQGYTYEGKQGSSHVFYMQRENWLHANKVTYDVFEEVLKINEVEGGWTIERENNMPIVREYRGRDVYMTHDEIATMISIPIEEVIERSKTVVIVENRDPATCFTNIFPQITPATGGVYDGNIFINGVISDFYKIGSLKTSYNMTGRDYVVEWRLYNNGQVGDTTSLSSGNFGESFKRRYLKSDPSSRSISLVEAEGKAVYNAEEHTLTYDPAAGQAILELYIEFMPAQGKNDSYSGYYNILTGEICQTLKG